MRTEPVDTTIFGATSLLALALGGVATEEIAAGAGAPIGEASALAGVWLNADNTVRLQLAADWSYAGRVEGRHRSAKGIYRPDGPGLLLRDESGLRTAVTVADQVLEMAGHRLFRA